MLIRKPEEAQSPEMPIAAIEANAVDYCLPIKDIAAKLSELSVSSGHTVASAALF